MLVGEWAHPAAAQVRHEFAPGSSALKLGVFPHIADLLKIFFVPRSGAAHRECQRINGVGTSP
jgi:hypothetical protein